jgi:DNA-binding beta-propeller fold protein YncE
VGKQSLAVHALSLILERINMSLRKTTVFIAIFAFLVSLMLAFPLPTQKVQAQAETAFGPENFPKSGESKAKFTRNFNAPDTLIPYTLTAINGDGNGSQFVKKATITLNGQEIVTLTKGLRTFVLSIRLQSQNTLSLIMKGPSEGFVKISIEPARATLINDPDDSDFESTQAGVGYPVSASVDSTTHRAYIADAGRDAIIEFDMNDARVTRIFDNVDGTSAVGDGGTSGVCINTGTRNMVAVNPADNNSGGNGTLSVINLDNGSVRTLSQGNMHPFSVASNANTNSAAFTALFNPNNKRAYFLDIASNTVTTRDENLSLFAVANNPITNEFVFTGSDGTSKNSLLVYEARAPFRRLKEIQTSARGNTLFDKIAINPANNFAVALNLREGAVFIFDIAAGRELARIPIRVVRTDFAEGDVAINPETNMAVVVNKSLNVLYVIDLATLVLRGELPLPNGSKPVGVGIDTVLNRAAVTETGFSGGSHNGSVLIVQLPQR